MQKNPCIMQVRAESSKSALPLSNYSHYLVSDFLVYTKHETVSKSG